MLLLFLAGCGGGSDATADAAGDIATTADQDDGAATSDDTVTGDGTEPAGSATTVVDVRDLDPANAPYPGAHAVEVARNDACIAGPFEPYIGRDYATSEIVVRSFLPTAGVTDSQVSR